MKKVLSFTLCAVMAVSAYSQSLWSDNFESYNTGNLGSQGGWARDGGGTANWTQVANTDAEHGKSFKLASTGANDGVWHYHDTDWATKNSDNKIFLLEFDYLTGAPANTGYGVTQIYDADADFALVMEIGWDPEDGIIYIADEFGFEILDEAATANTWYHIKAAYDQETGETKIQLNNNEPFVFYGTPFLEPTEYDVLLAGISTCGFDNITVSATNVDPFLATTNVSAKSKLNIYPNPATDVINIVSDSRIAQVSIFDASGKVVKTSTENAINVGKLAKGSYIVSIKYADGTTESKKVIKK